MTFIGIQNNISLISNKKRPNKFQTKLENSGHSVKSECSDSRKLLGKSGTYSRANSWDF